LTYHAVNNGKEEDYSATHKTKPENLVNEIKMNRNLVVLIIVLILIVALAFTVYLQYSKVHQNNNHLPEEPVLNINTNLGYETIQAAIDAPETLDGHTIFVKSGVYYEHVVLNKSISLIGEDRTDTTIIGNGTGIGILVNANSVTVKGFTVKNCSTGIRVVSVNNSAIMENIVIFNRNAILVDYSSNCKIYQNIAGNNTERGILVTGSQNFTISRNDVYDNGMYGLNANFSANGIIKQNFAYENYYDGIGLLDSNNCTVIGNTLKKNQLYGILASSSSYCRIYHNNIIQNGIQASDLNATNQWDNGVEGNYWSSYTGTDTNNDGIGDTAYVISDLNRDNYPLMGMFHSYNVTESYYVNVVSNSTIESFEFFASNNTIRMYVSNLTSIQSFGFCRIAIPKALMSPLYTVVIDDGLTEVLNFNATVHDDDIYRWIYFVYQHSTRKVVITS